MQLRSEEEIRSKVVMTWLAGLGFSPEDILVEPTFEVRLGRSVLKADSRSQRDPGKFNPRADVLVRHVDGRNLLIVEVKAPSEPLDDNAREQGLAYARLLRNGGIAPFVVLTNGVNTRIFDSISGKELGSEGIPPEHGHVKAGFVATGDIQELRATALEILVSLNPANLMLFCREQVALRMRKLRDINLLSGRKYVPDLYINRPEAQKRLHELIARGRRVILLIGPPQVGKTNLMCHTVEQRLNEGLPTLFYPASAIGGLSEELQDDFEWILKQGVASQSILAERLSNIARASGKQLAVFIDGWNEATIDAARSIDQDVERIVSSQISFIISMTTVAARRLLTDQTGDPSFIADSAGVNQQDLLQLELRSSFQNRNWDIVRLENYNYEETELAYQHYANLLNVQVPYRHRKVSDPLLLRTAMLSCQGGVLPESLEEPLWLGRLIEAKLGRARLRTPQAGRSLLTTAAEELLAHGSPIREDRLTARWGIPLSEGVPDGLFEAAILIRRAGTGKSTGVDFYYERERDFVIAYWTRNWDRWMDTEVSTIKSELADIVQTEVGRSSLEWFLTESTNNELLKKVFGDLACHDNPTVRRLLMSCAASNFWAEPIDPDWQVYAIRAGLKDGSMEVRLEAAEFLDRLRIEGEERSPLSTLAKDRQSIQNLLMVDSQFPLEPRTTGEIALRAFLALHSEGAEPEDFDEWDFDHGSSVTRVLADLAGTPEYRAIAMKAFAYIAPHAFFEWLTPQLPSDGKLAQEYTDAILDALGNATDRIHEFLYTMHEREGGMLDALKERSSNRRERKKDLESHREWFQRLRQIYSPIIKNFDCQELQQFLDDLEPEEDKRKARTPKSRPKRA
ncbi:type I restriction enzyme HsdR N-terminal domain-containing protein [Hyalangium gracile]|uniref:type I restriction enzyme HsdR N-terminal domain-containing protein n=1 Tax=Hyalangium gracile TaxID=394092 RepID=UPI001CCC6738|nr:type I restriction enzyme HsdR N-terminal domain-containing protein [Hyalangium gracile]